MEEGLVFHAEGIILSCREDQPFASKGTDPRIDVTIRSWLNVLYAKG